MNFSESPTRLICAELAEVQVPQGPATQKNPAGLAGPRAIHSQTRRPRPLKAREIVARARSLTPRPFGTWALDGRPVWQWQTLVAIHLSRKRRVNVSADIFGRFRRVKAEAAERKVVVGRY